MAQASFDRDVRGLPVNVGLLVSIVVGVVAFFVTFDGVQSWVDGRADSRIDRYANVEIFPRIVELERNVQQIRKDQQRTIEMIETQDRSRNRQYGEIKSQNDTVLERLEEIQALGIRK